MKSDKSQSELTLEESLDHQLEAEDEGCIEVELAAQLTAAVQRDSLEQLQQLTRSFNLTTADLGRLFPRLSTSPQGADQGCSRCCYSRGRQRDNADEKVRIGMQGEDVVEEAVVKETDKPRSRRGFRRLAHMCVLFHSVQLLRHFASDPQLQQLLLMEDSDGSNVLHSLAKVRMLREADEKMSEDQISEFEDLVMKLLSSMGESTEPIDEEEQIKPSALQLMCFQENQETLRPLEFAMDIGAYAVFQKICRVPGFLLRRRKRLGPHLHETYDLREYDPFFGSRKQCSPLFLLSMMDLDKVDTLNKSRLMQWELMISWWQESCKQMSRVLLVRTICLVVLILQVTPFGLSFTNILTMAQRAYELQQGYIEYSKFVIAEFDKANSSLDDSQIIAMVTEACKPNELYKFLINGSRGDVVLKGSLLIPILAPVTRRDIVSEAVVLYPFYANVILIITFLPLAVTSGWWLRRNKRQPWYEPKREYFTFTSFYYFCLLITMALGVFHTACSFSISPFLDCTDFVLGRFSLTTLLLPFLVTLTEISALLYMFFAMLLLNELMETSSRFVAFLSICFRKMCTKFLNVLPLLILWAYIVFGSLMYVGDFKNKEFATSYDVLYAPMELLLGTAEFEDPRLSTVIMHTLFAVIVVINIQNFLIAYVSDEYSEMARNFDLVYRLTRLCHFYYATMSISWCRCLITKKDRDAAKEKRYEIAEVSFGDEGPDFDWRYTVSEELESEI